MNSESVIYNSIMSLMLQILVRAGALAALGTPMACGQQGPLYLPQTEGRPSASLPDSLLPAKTPKDTAPASPTLVPAAKPASTPAMP
jgi:predicted small lipoprotein YifL